MRVKLDLGAEVKKLAGNFGFNDGEGKFNCNLEVEFAPEEMMEVIKMQKEIVPGVLNFVKEMQEMSNDTNEKNCKIDSLQFNLDRERDKNKILEEKIEILESRNKEEK